MMETAMFTLPSEFNAVAISPPSLTRALRSIFLLIASLMLNCTVSSAAVQAQASSEPALVLQAYLRATYARDFAEAYRYISSSDQKARDLNRYLKLRGPFAGFTLEVARKLSEAVEISVGHRKGDTGRLETTVKYKAPDPKALAPLLYDWNAHRLNSLAPAEREQILRAIEQKRRDSAFEWSEGEEKFQLVREGRQWRVYLDWASGVKIPLRLDVTQVADLEMSLSKSLIVTQPGEPFDIVLKIKNRSNRRAVARIGHLIEPKSLADFLEFVQCGFLLPVTLAPGEEREFFGTYLLRGSLPDGVRQLSLTYDFRLLE
jgi:hypothetical protein